MPTTDNQHADRAKDVLYFYLCHASGRALDRRETDQIVDEIIAAMHFEIHREMRAAMGKDK